MEPDDAGDVTQLLHALKNGDTRAQSELATKVYGELRRIARRNMRAERQNHTLQPTALVHEAYAHLVTHEGKTFQNRAHFYGVACQVMRRILIDYARASQAQKRGGQGCPLPLDFDIPVEVPDVEEVLAVDAALLRLEKVDTRQSRVVELRYFGGMTEDEISEVLGISTRTVKRDWTMARAFLRNELRGLPARVAAT